MDAMCRFLIIVVIFQAFLLIYFAVFSKPNYIKYKHFKGGIYQLYAVGKHHETGKEYAIYFDPKTKEIWLREACDFFGEVSINGINCRRFQKV